MIYKSKAPLRLGLAGGGTDVSPYSDEFGGNILNATISLFAHANIIPTNDHLIHLSCLDLNCSTTFDVAEKIPNDAEFKLLTGVYNKIQEIYPFDTKGFKLTTYVDVPAGSGLGSSSTLVVAIIGAFVEMLNLPLGEYDIAKLAFEIERKDLKLAGGKQDQYAATFGGFNFMEFYENDRVIVNPLRIKSNYIHELESNLLLFYTQSSRESATIIEAQQKNVSQKNTKSIDAMHSIKKQAFNMKEAVLKGRFKDLGGLLDIGFEQKKKMAKNISNSTIDNIYETAKKAGAIGGKISGAGGGGFMIFYCEENSRFKIIDALNQLGVQMQNYSFTNKGLTTWTIFES